MSILEKYGNAAVYIAAIAGVAGGLWATLDALDARPVFERELLIEHDVAALALTNLQQVTDKNFADLLEKVEDTATSVLIVQFDNLMRKRKENGSLSFEEQAKLCLIGSQLGYPNVPGC